MRLCFIADANSIHTQRWIAPLVQRGHQVYLLSPKSVKRRWEGLSGLADLSKIYDARKLRFAYWGWWIRRYVRQTRPDVLHAHQLTGAGWLGAMAGYHPFVVTGWGSDILIEPRKSALRRALVRAVLRQCDSLTVPSRLLYDAARSLGVPKSQLRLIPWGIEMDIFREEPDDRDETRRELGIAADASVVLSTRKVSALYNLDIVLEAVKNVEMPSRMLRLVVVCFSAEPDYLAMLKSLSAEYGLGETVLWVPAQETPKDMARLYRAADIVISIPTSEGYGFTVYEAMATGCPTLITDLPVFKHELTDGVHTLKVPVRDAVSTSQALSRLLTDENLRRQLRQNGLAACRDKSVETRIEQTCALYRELASRSCPA